MVLTTNFWSFSELMFNTGFTVGQDKQKFEHKIENIFLPIIFNISHWMMYDKCSWSGVVLDCINSWSLPSFLLSNIKFLTLVTCQKSLDKQCRHRSDCFWMVGIHKKLWSDCFPFIMRSELGLHLLHLSHYFCLPHLKKCNGFL